MGGCPAAARPLQRDGRDRTIPLHAWPRTQIRAARSRIGRRSLFPRPRRLLHVQETDHGNQSRKGGMPAAISVIVPQVPRMAPPLPAVVFLLALVACVARGQLNTIGTLPLTSAAELILTSTATKVPIRLRRHPITTTH